jgi:hypothetical protein
MTDLLGVADRNLKDAGTKGLSLDGRFRFAYEAALQCALAALSAAGYRPARQLHHYRAIESLALTMGESSENVRFLDGCRKKRNVADYERSGTITEKELEEVLEYANDLRSRFADWLREHYPELLPD